MPQTQQPDPAHERADRLRRLEEIFGDVLPSQTRDDVAEAGDPAHDRWLLDQVPPHHTGP